MATTDETNQDPDNVARQISNGFSAADSAATGLTQRLSLVHRARQSRNTREIATLTAQFGATDPRVVAAQARAAATQSTIAQLALAQNRQSLPKVTVTERGFAVQGFVLDAKDKPLPRFTVYFADAGNEFQRAYGFAYSDDKGYFVINYAGAFESSAPAFYLAALNAKAQPIYLSTEAFQPVVGAAKIQNIRIAAGAPVLGAPSVAIREVAFPSTTKSTS